MAKFKIAIERKIIEFAEIEIEANDREDAQSLFDNMNKNDLDWQYGGCDENDESCSIEELED